SKRQLPGGKVRAIVASSGNSNVFTGSQGRVLVENTAAAVAKSVGCRTSQVFLASTGVIGEKKDIRFVADKVPMGVKALKNAAWHDAARSIMTTDRFPKAVVRKVKIGNVDVTLAGIAKGSTMIAPDMGTMLSFLFTDAKIPAKVLQTCLTRAVDRSFNCISVDGDTSTSDTVLLCATGQVKRQPTIERASDSALKDFRAALEDMTVELAQMIVRDGAATGNLLTCDVVGAESQRAARNIGRAIVDSTLVRKGIAGAEPRAGRIVMAVGKAGEKAERDLLSISIGNIVVAKSGESSPNIDEGVVVSHLRSGQVHFTVDIGIGRGKARVWSAL
ncbi:MAG: bifunctional ornithine acetyltransferase/N-acetylglutamate synthase, partial [Rhodospirillaceae bacterium]|nr:bifunctional ornithine acetyltransferase/N-acetylglutamate synthase [Rhodospirillaceae bacterium]